MARFTRLEVLNEIVRIGVVPVFYETDLEVAENIVAACRRAGARVVEFTNRGDNAYRLFSDLVLHFAEADPSVILGVGSVLDPATAAIYIASGASFVVGPVLNPEVARICNRRKIAYSPGCGSASEISEAEELGVEIVKVFPGDSVGGPAFVKALLGPCPWTRLMPTGGVEASEDSVSAWIKAGAAALGMGSKLIKKEWVNRGAYTTIAEQTAQVIGWISKARGQNVFQGIEHVGLHQTAQAPADEMVAWYEKTLGFQVRETNSSFFLSGGGSGRIEIPRGQVESACHVAVRVIDFEAAVEDLRARGIELLDPKVTPTSKSVHLKDPDPAGNTVHLLWLA